MIQRPVMKSGALKNNYIDTEATKASLMKQNPSIMSGGFVLASSKKTTRKESLNLLNLESIREPEPEILKDSEVVIRSMHSN